MALLTQTPYKARTFDLSGLTGISDNTLEVHFGLYGGYVKNVNLLNEQLVTMQSAGQSSNPAYAELTRRLAETSGGGLPCYLPLTSRRSSPRTSWKRPSTVTGSQ